jgi:hypothetical protein
VVIGVEDDAAVRELGIHALHADAVSGVLAGSEGAPRCGVVHEPSGKLAGVLGQEGSPDRVDREDRSAVTRLRQRALCAGPTVREDRRGHVAKPDLATGLVLDRNELASDKHLRVSDRQGTVTGIGNHLAASHEYDLVVVPRLRNRNGRNRESALECLGRRPGEVGGTQVGLIAAARTGGPGGLRHEGDRSPREREGSLLHRYVRAGAGGRGRGDGIRHVVAGDGHVDDDRREAREARTGLAREGQDRRADAFLRRRVENGRRQAARFEHDALEQLVAVLELHRIRPVRDGDRGAQGRVHDRRPAVRRDEHPIRGVIGLRGDRDIASVLVREDVARRAGRHQIPGGCLRLFGRRLGIAATATARGDEGCEESDRGRPAGHHERCPRLRDLHLHGVSPLGVVDGTLGRGAKMAPPVLLLLQDNRCFVNTCPHHHVKALPHSAVGL